VIQNRVMQRVRGPRTAFVAVAASIAILSSGCSGSSSRPSSLAATSTTAAPGASTPTTARRAGCARPHAAGQFSQSFTFKGVARTYELYVPKTYQGTKKVPLVLNFHGYGSDAVQQMAYGDFKPLADRDDFLIVAPNGQVPGNRHFNISGEAGLQNDIEMVSALIDHIEVTLCVNPKRVYSTGMSDGGAMTSVLACRMSDRIAAFAPVALVLTCGATKAVPIVAFAGTADPVIQFNGGKVNCCGGPTLGSEPDAMASWAATDHCAVKFREKHLDTEVTRRRWTGCDRRSAAIFYIIEGGGHTWPGSIPIDRLGMTTKQIDASETIWKFFKGRSLA
jgi:polyhydroxybutyrate depolymerase